MRALDRKLFRDLGRMKMQAAAIAMVVASGVALFVATLSAYRSLRASQGQYYSEQRFAQVWSRLSRAPLSVASAIEAIPGVTGVEGRIVQQATLDVPGLDEPASALLVSIPAAAGHAVNDLYVRRGRHVEPGQRSEVLVSEAFADTNHLALGSTMTAMVAGRSVVLRFVGVALSPEYVMPIPPNGLTPDNRRFAVLWMARDQLEGLTDLRDAFNEVAVALAPRADERAVIRAMDFVLDPYGGCGAYGRDSQASNTMLEDHIQQLGSLARVVPTIFLLVTAFLVNLVLSRAVAAQREQIGMLKAFGYTSRRVAIHYLELTGVVVLAGIVIGLPVGAALGRTMAVFYAGFFRFPVLVFKVEPKVVTAASVVALVAAAIGVIGAIRSVVATSLVVAMSPEVPAFRPSPASGFWQSRLLSPSSRMIVRNVTQRPLRSTLAVGAMSLAVAVVVLGSSSADALDRMRDVHFQAAAREDVTVTLTHVRAVDTVRDFLAVPGVTRAEPHRVVPARLLARGGTHDVTLVGLPDGGTLKRAVDTAYHVVPIPRDGVVLTAWLAARVGLRRGDALSFEIRENQRRLVTTRLVDLVDEPLGLTAYMDLGALGRLLDEPGTFSGATLLVDRVEEHELNAALKRMPALLAVDFRRGALASYRSMSDSAVAFIRRIEVVFSVIIAFGVVYNSAKISLAERGRELATLRVLGFTRSEVSAILLGEVAFLAALAIPLGLGAGYGLSGMVAAAMTGQRMHVPHIVSLTTYAFACVVFIVAGGASAFLVRRGLDRLDLVAVLKARE